MCTAPKAGQEAKAWICNLRRFYSGTLPTSICMPHWQMPIQLHRLLGLMCNRSLGQRLIRGCTDSKHPPQCLGMDLLPIPDPHGSFTPCQKSHSWIILCSGCVLGETDSNSIMEGTMDLAIGDLGPRRAWIQFHYGGDHGSRDR